MKRVLLGIIIIAFLFMPGLSGYEGVSNSESVSMVVSVLAEPEAVQTADPHLEILPYTTDRPEIVTPVVVTKPVQVSAAEPTQVSVVAAGDLMCLYAQLCAARKGKGYNFDYCFDRIKEKISSADLAICNLETLVAKGYKYTGRSPETGSPKLNAPESYLSAVVNCGFDVIINANNHIYDRRASGINKTIAAMDKYGIKHTGAYASGQERVPLITDVKGIKIAVLSYTDHINGHSKTKMADRYSKALVTSDMAAVKEAGADFIIVYMHWGRENTHKVNSFQKKAAAFIANEGANIIIGSHPHCTQGTTSIETDHGKVPVFYSLGNLISSMGRTINKDSVLVNMVLEKDAEIGETALKELTYTATLCSGTKAGPYVIFLADLETIESSSKAKLLKASRARTIKVLKEGIATPE